MGLQIISERDGFILDLCAPSASTALSAMTTASKNLTTTVSIHHNNINNADKKNNNPMASNHATSNPVEAGAKNASKKSSNSMASNIDRGQRSTNGRRSVKSPMVTTTENEPKNNINLVIN